MELRSLRPYRSKGTSKTIEIALVHPPSDPLIHETIFGIMTPPLGLAYVAAYFDNKGFKPKIMDHSLLKCVL
jgi:hypothetical protein